MLSLQWKSAGWRSVALIITNIIQGVSQIGSSYFNALIIAQFPLLIIGETTVKSAIIIVFARIAYQFVINAIYAANRYFEEKVSNAIQLDMDAAFFNKLYSLGQDQLESAKYNQTITRVKNDSYLLSNITRNFSFFIGELFGFIGAIISLMFIQPILGIIVLLIAVPLSKLELRQIKLRRDAYKKTESHLRIKNSLGWYIHDGDFLPEIRLSNGLMGLLRIYAKHSKVIYEEDEKIELQSLKASIVNDFTQLAVLLASDVWLVFKAAAAEMTLDGILFARNLIQTAVNSSGSIARSTRDLSEGIVYLGDLQTFFEFPSTLPDGTTKLNTDNGVSIEFKDVYFSYPSSDEEVLKGISFKLEPNENFAIVGLNGAGKSTLVKMILGEYRPSSGSILVNGIPLDEYDRTSYTKNISVLMQDFMMINPITLRQNLQIGNENATDKEIKDALKSVGMLKTVESLEFQLNSRLHSHFEDGTQLSGGQSQKIAIARALLKKSKLMVLDEPTSAIDSRSEEEIFDKLFEEKNRSAIIISHRFSTVREADKILVLEEGVVTERGTHAQLMKNKGLYHELFTKQAKGYK